MTDLSGAGAIENDPASKAHIARQQAEFAQSQVDAKAAADAEAAAHPCDTSAAGIRSRGGYMLMDPEWVAGGPWNGIPAGEQQSEANRRADIVEQMRAGTAFGFTHTFDSLDPFATDLAGWFPASKAGRDNLAAREGDARLEYAMTTGNELATCKADSQFYVSRG